MFSFFVFSQVHDKKNISSTGSSSTLEQSLQMQVPGGMFKQPILPVPAPTLAPVFAPAAGFGSAIKSKDAAKAAVGGGINFGAVNSGFAAASAPAAGFGSAIKSVDAAKGKDDPCISKRGRSISQTLAAEDIYCSQAIMKMLLSSIPQLLDNRSLSALEPLQQEKILFLVVSEVRKTSQRLFVFENRKHKGSSSVASPVAEKVISFLTSEESKHQKFDGFRDGLLLAIKTELSESSCIESPINAFEPFSGMQTYKKSGLTLCLEKIASESKVAIDYLRILSPHRVMDMDTFSPLSSSQQSFVKNAVEMCIPFLWHFLIKGYVLEIPEFVSSAWSMVVSCCEEIVIYAKSHIRSYMSGLKESRSVEDEADYHSGSVASITDIILGLLQVHQSNRLSGECRPATFNDSIEQAVLSLVEICTPEDAPFLAEVVLPHLSDFDSSYLVRGVTDILNILNLYVDQPLSSSGNEFSAHNFISGGSGCGDPIWSCGDSSRNENDNHRVSYEAYTHVTPAIKAEVDRALVRFLPRLISKNGLKHKSLSLISRIYDLIFPPNALCLNQSIVFSTKYKYSAIHINSFGVQLKQMLQETSKEKEVDVALLNILPKFIQSLNKSQILAFFTVDIQQLILDRFSGFSLEMDDSEHLKVGYFRIISTLFGCGTTSCGNNQKSGNSYNVSTTNHHTSRSQDYNYVGGGGGSDSSIDRANTCVTTCVTTTTVTVTVNPARNLTLFMIDVIGGGEKNPFLWSLARRMAEPKVG